MASVGLTPGARAAVSVTVGPEDTAQRVGSGDVPVLATPRLLALAEAATVKAIEGRLAPGETSVGTRVDLRHRAASPVGTLVEIVAELAQVDGRRLTFEVTATDQHGTVVATATIERAAVDRQSFISRLPS